MARIFKNPNPYSKVLEQKHTGRLISICFILLALAAAFWLTKTKNIYAGLVVLFFGGVLFAIADFVFKRISQNDQGQDGEFEILGMLSSDYIVFQNVPIKKNLDIDLVLVGPTGIYAIEVKSHRRFFQGTNGQDFIGQTLRETLALQEHLQKSGINLYVKGVLVFSRAFVKFGFTAQRGIYVIGKKFLIPLLDRGQLVQFDRAKAESIIRHLYQVELFN